jgi:predicted transcriptional regulator
MTTKSQILKAIQDMDEDVTFDEVIERLCFLYKVNKGLKQVETGDTLTHDEVKQRIKTWQK